MLTYFLLWLPMLFIAIANGFLREFIFKKWMADLTAHQLSTLTLIFFFAVYIGFVIKKFLPSSSSHALFIGCFWLVLTLIFEFGFGRWRGHSWGDLLQDYQFWKGKLWVFIPLWVMIAPLLFYKIFR